MVQMSIAKLALLALPLRNMALTSSDPEAAPVHVEDTKPRTARRNLFGPVDHQQLQQDFQQLLCMSVEEATRRWNFDFQRERPMQGATQWEELRCWDVPKFYHSCVVKGGCVGSRPELSVEERGPGSPAAGGYLEIKARETYRSRKPEKRSSAPDVLKQKQAAITGEWAPPRHTG